MRKRSNFLSWKSLFLERHMQDCIEQAQPQYADEENMEDITTLLCPYIQTLEISQLQAWKPPLTWSQEDIPDVYPIDHINFEPILKRLENIKELDIIYGMKNVDADKFDFRLFQMSRDDCRNLGRGVLLLKNITVLRLHRSQLKDEQVQALMQGLIKNKTLQELDLSHCVIGDHGALCIARVLTQHPTLTKLILCDNQIKTQGAEGTQHLDCCITFNLFLIRYSICNLARKLLSSGAFKSASKSFRTRWCSWNNASACTK